VGKRSTSSDDVKVVTSLIVTRDGVDIASVSEHISAQALSDVGSVRVDGLVDNNVVGEKGYISMTWTYPSVSQGGNYSCIVHGIDEAGHDVTFSSSVFVDIAEPSINDLVGYIHALQVENNKLKVNLSQQEEHINEQDQTIKQQDQTIKQQGQTITQQGQTIKQHETMIAERSHLEEGSFYCGSSPNWNDGNTVVYTPESGSRHFRYKDFPVRFSKPYTKTPRVSVEVQDGHWGADDFAWFRVDARAVGTQGFTLRCGINIDGNHRIDYLRVRWLAIPSA